MCIRDRREGVAFFEAHAGFAHRRGGVIDGEGLGWIAVVECDERGHDLGGRGDLDGGIGFALVIHGSIGTHDDLSLIHI